ncbi:alpha/beta fold hydrolase [Kibdelosporangium persicum]|uniref:Pimeloyl-ACP methyl ester carboxylesterase n=1 Tax=Kibdelosporangium persicum TaxID=2698649 RepID=A0ABX2F313_9PSEU|nr:alpha/beta hydrolase [Kibdelosporangium persicum]NRN65390.1 Pimeloyl-ACP methyl ester carboxylesterase [Kibdelosporangium persicum]
MVQATLHDASRIDVEVHGTGPTVLLPVNPVPVTGQRADEMRNWGVDPALGRSLIDGLSDAFRVVAFDYEGHVIATPKPDTLTPDNIAADFLAVADAAGAERFAYYGYSWLALSGLQLAIRTDRLTALVMGGFPALAGPYAEMLAVTAATHASSGAPRSSEPPARKSGDEYDWSTAEVTMSEEQTRQFMTLYVALQGFDDRAVQSRVTCPRLCFVGSKDTIVYDERWGGVTVDIAGAVADHHGELEAAGWQVHILDGLDHTQAMQPGAVLPVLRPWLITAAGRAQSGNG